jgi:diguanylate cyclase (GGDEF)-like protein
MSQALNTAERLRCDFAAMRWPGIDIDATVSVGVAMASDTSRDLPALLAIADRALYRAKADGRNRVARAPLTLVDNGAGESVRRASEQSAAWAAPAAG